MTCEPVNSFSFSIQASAPMASRRGDIEDTSLSDAIQTIFPLHTELAFMCWNWGYIPLSYKCDWSEIVDDVIGMTVAIADAPTGRLEIDWPSNTFSAHWAVGWTEALVTVDAEWREVGGIAAERLNARPRLVWSRPGFLAEWRGPLVLLRNALDDAGYRSQLASRMAALDGATERCIGPAALYP